MKKIAFLLCLAVMSAACATQYNTKTRNPNSATAFRVSAFDNVYVARALDVWVNGIPVQGSGLETSKALVQSFRSTSNRVILGDTPLNAKADIQLAKDEKFDFIILPQIITWSSSRKVVGQETTEEPARLGVKILMVDLRNDRIIKLSTLTAVAGERLPFGSGTHLPLELRSPQQLLLPTFEAFSHLMVEEIF